VTNAWLRSEGIAEDEREGSARDTIGRPLSRMCQGPRHHQRPRPVNRPRAAPVWWRHTSAPHRFGALTAWALPVLPAWMDPVAFVLGPV
jgi:hypothetical protein